MPAVTGNVRTWGLQPFPTGERLLLRFVPSSAASSPSALLPLREEVVEPGSTGAFSVTLAATTAIVADVWYTIRFEWFGSVDNAQLVRWSELPGRLRVPAAGGNVSQLIEMTPPPGSILYGYGPPPASLSDVSYIDVSGTKPVLYAPKGALI